MTSKTIHILDLYFAILNWTNARNTVLSEYAKFYEDSKHPPSWKREIEDEIRNWTRSINRDLNKLKSCAETLTEDEYKQLLRRDPLISVRLESIGVRLRDLMTCF